jgi:zinc and cadmium transporter
MQFLMSLVAGLMLGVAILHLLPHAAVDLPSLDHAVAWMLIGPLGDVLYDSTVPRAPALVRRSECAGGGRRARNHDSCPGHDHPGHVHSHDHPGHDHGKLPPWRFSWVGLAFGLILHSFFDGVALGGADGR